MAQDFLDPEPLYELRGHKSTILGTKFSSDGNNFVTCGLDNFLVFYQLNKQSHHYKLNGHSDVIYSVDYTNGSLDASGNHNEFILSGSRDKTVRLWHINTNLNRPEVNDKSPVVFYCGNTIRSVHSSPDIQSFVTGSDDKSVKVWSMSVPNKRLNTFLGHTNWVKCCKFSTQNSDLIASCGDDSTLRLWDLRTNGRKGAALKTIEATRNRHFTYLDWFPKLDCFIAVASNNNMIRIYDTRKMANIVQFYAAHQDSVNGVSFHPSGNYLLSCSSDKTCKLIDVIEGRVLYTLRGHTKPLFACTFDAEGDHFMTAGADAGVRLWKSNLTPSCNCEDEFIVDQPYQSNMIDTNKDANDIISKTFPSEIDELLVNQGSCMNAWKTYDSMSEAYSLMPDQLVEEEDSIDLFNNDTSQKATEKCEDTTSLHELMKNMLQHIETLANAVNRLEVRISTLEKK